MAGYIYVASPKLKKLFYVGPGSQINIEDLEGDLQYFEEFVKFLDENIPSIEPSNILEKKIEELRLKDFGFYANILAYLKEFCSKVSSLMVYYVIKLFDKEAFLINCETEEFQKLVKEQGYEIVDFDK